MSDSDPRSRRNFDYAEYGVTNQSVTLAPGDSLPPPDDLPPSYSSLYDTTTSDSPVRFVAPAPFVYVSPEVPSAPPGQCDAAALFVNMLHHTIYFSPRLQLLWIFKENGDACTRVFSLRNHSKH